MIFIRSSAMLRLATIFTLCAFAAIPAFCQVVNPSDKINDYYEYSDGKEYKKAALTAIEVGDVYFKAGQHDFAKKFYEYGINESERSDDVALQANAYFKAGLSAFFYGENTTDYKKKKELYDLAKKYFQKAARHFTGSDKTFAEENILSHYYGGLCHYKLDEYKQAIVPLDRALRYAQKEKNNKMASESSALLAKIYGVLDEPISAEYYQSIYQSYTTYNETIDSLEQTKQTNQQLSQAIEEKETELNERNLALENARIRAEKDALLLKQSRDRLIYVGGGAAVILLMLIFIFRAYRFTKRAKKELEAKNIEITKQKSLLEKRQAQLREEKAKSERLLLNILPKSIAAQLRENGKPAPLYYKKVTVMFTDFKGFTRLVEKMSPPEIVRELDICFHAFDNIIEKHKLEKIKTMGDGYMCAGGLPNVNETNPLDAIKAAVEMMDFIRRRKEEKRREGKDYFDLRIGIHTGPVIAGVVGKRKFAYDIWGDTVNVASRMESSGQEGKINVSGSTFRLAEDHFFFTPRGKILAKGKGEIEMFFVDGRVKYAVNRQRQ